MRYMYFVQAAPDGAPPPPRLMEEIAKMGEQAVKDGKMVTTGGLMPISQAVRVRLKGGKLSVTDGPFAESKEVVGGFAIFELASREEAIQGAIDFMEVHRLYGGDWEGVCELREMVDTPPGVPGCGQA